MGAEASMNRTVYISDDGDDSNDGFTIHTPVYSWKEAYKLKGGDNSIDMHFIGNAAERIKKEIAKGKKGKKKKK
jgi:hypothetical protein